MTVDELIDMAKFFYSFNDAQTDTPISTARWVQIMNWAYKRVWIDVTQNVSRKHVLAYQDFTWAASTNELELPVALQQKSLYKFRDVTDVDAGHPITPGWLNKNTLTWYPDGPSEARTIRAFYISSPEVLLSGGPGPVLIQPDFHEIVAWEAVNQLMKVTDGKSQYEDQLFEWQQRLYKALATRPLADAARIVDVETGWYEPALPVAATAGGGYSDSSAPLSSP